MSALARVEKFVRSWRHEPGSADTLAGAMESGDMGGMDYLTVPDLLEILRWARVASQAHALALTHNGGRGDCDCDLCEVLRDAGLKTSL